MLIESYDPATVVHVLHHGRALCPQEGIPRDWPVGHKWVPIGCANESNCDPCKAVAKELPDHGRPG